VFSDSKIPGCASHLGCFWAVFNRSSKVILLAISHSSKTLTPASKLEAGLGAGVMILGTFRWLLNLGFATS
jgi:hypothetical protein